MDIINSKQVLNRLIKETFWDDPEDNIEFPRILHFCEGIGWDTYKITIERVDKNIYIDKNGDKWIKCKKNDG